jgi:uncharacterized membrane protein YcaP (DUF421 family)
MEIFKNDYLNIVFSSVVVYIFIVIAIRLFGKKELSQLSIIDLVFILLISNAVQNAMVGSNTTLPGGLVAASALFIVNYILKLVIFYFPNLGKAIQGKEILLVYKGKINEENMRKARFSMDELLEAIREHGVASIDKIDLAILEVDGNISVLSNEFNHKTIRKRKAHKSLMDQH